MLCWIAMKAHPGTDMHGTKIIPDPYGTVVSTRSVPQ
jgi:hypothetical protein